MNKKTLSILAGTSLAIVTGSLFVNQATPKIVSSINAETCNHEGNHYQKLDPTYTTSGHREYWSCCKCHNSFLTNPGGNFTDKANDSEAVGTMDYENPAFLPTLNEEDYTRTDSNKHSQTLTETWTLKNPTLTSEQPYVLTKSLKSGFIIVNDSSSGTNVSKDYTAYSFNKTFEGIEMSYDEKNKALTLNITKEDGYTFNKCTITFPSSEGNTVTITGYPLTVIAPEGTTNDGISFWGSTGGTSEWCVATIDTEVTAIYPSQYTKTTEKSGIYATKMTINSGASLKSYGFKYGITERLHPVTVNGLLDASGTDASIVSNNTSNNREIKLNANTDLYLDHGKVQTGGSTYTNNTSLTHHISVIPKGANINNYFELGGVVAVEPTTTSTGTLNIVCNSCKQPRFTEELPILNGLNYDIEAETIYEGGSYYDTTTYTLKKTDYGVIEIHTSKKLLTNYIIAGLNIYSSNTWNTLYKKAVATETTEDAKVNLTITLSDDLELNFGASGSLDFTKYNKVTIDGQGTLKITTNQKNAINASNLVVGENVVLELNGTSYSGATFYGIKTTTSLDIAGTIVIDNFYRGLLPNGTATIQDTGSVTITNCVVGVYNDATSTFNNLGNLYINALNAPNTSESAAGFYDSVKTVNYNFAGNSTTSINTKYRGFDTYGEGTGNDVNIRVSGNSNFSVISTGTSTKAVGIYNPRTFIVENLDESQCSAEVYIETNSSNGIEYFSWSGHANSLIVNSTKQMKIYKNSSNKTYSGIKFYACNLTLKVMSEIVIQNYESALSCGNGKPVLSDVQCDHKIVAVDCKNNYTNWNTNISSWFKVD